MLRLHRGELLEPGTDRLGDTLAREFLRVLEILGRDLDGYLFQCGHRRTLPASKLVDKMACKTSFKAGLHYGKATRSESPAVIGSEQTSPRQMRAHYLR